MVHFRRADEFFWDHRFAACDPSRTGAAVILDRHRLQGDKDNSRKEELRRPDLHPPRCAELNANRMSCAIAALASNGGIGLKVPYLPDRCEPWPLERRLRQVLLLPAARVRQARVQVPAVWLSGWHAGMSRRWPQPEAGRPAGWRRVGRGPTHSLAVRKLGPGVRVRRECRDVRPKSARTVFAPRVLAGPALEPGALGPLEG
ncbi:MAG: hypothetical protein WHT82_06620 [Limisphaera sp.]